MQASPRAEIPSIEEEKTERKKEKKPAKTHTKTREFTKDLQVKDTGLVKFSNLFKNTLFTPIIKSVEIVYIRTLLIRTAE